MTAKYVSNLLKFPLTYCVYSHLHECHVAYSNAQTVKAKTEDAGAFRDKNNRWHFLCVTLSLCVPTVKKAKLDGPQGKTCDPGNRKRQITPLLCDVNL